MQIPAGTEYTMGNEVFKLGVMVNSIPGIEWLVGCFVVGF